MLGVATASPAAAQLALPGATAPAQVGTVVAPDSRSRGPRPRAAGFSAVAPLESKLGGKTLYLDGGQSQMAFVARDKTADLSRLLLTGTKISNSREVCQVDVSGMPLPLTPLGKVGGLLRFSIPVPACPVTFDVLDSAVVVTSETPVCAIKEADCSVSPGGLWGMPPGEIGAEQVKGIERTRMQAERSVRAAYQALVASTKDRAVIRGFASEQAGFSSRREEMCRDYIGEARHGFCASRLTQARAAALETELAAVQPGTNAGKKRPGTK